MNPFTFACELDGKGVEMTLASKAVDATAAKGADPDRPSACYSYIVAEEYKTLCQLDPPELTTKKLEHILELSALGLPAQGLEGGLTLDVELNLGDDLAVEEALTFHFNRTLECIKMVREWDNEDASTASTTVLKVLAELSSTHARAIAARAFEGRAGLGLRLLRIASIHKLRLERFLRTATPKGSVHHSAAGAAAGSGAVAAHPRYGESEPQAEALIASPASPNAPRPPPQPRLLSSYVLFKQALELIECPELDDDGALLGGGRSGVVKFFEDGGAFRARCSVDDQARLLRLLVSQWHQLLRASDSGRARRALAVQPQLVRLVLDAVSVRDAQHKSFTLLNTTGTLLLFAIKESAAFAQPPVQVIETLLLGGCNVNATDDEGVTPLMVACQLTLFDSAQVLLERGAQVNAADGWGYTALHRAVLGEAPERKESAPNVIELLLSMDADPTISVNEPWDTNVLGWLPPALRAMLADGTLEKLERVPAALFCAANCAAKKLPAETSELLPLSLEDVGESQQWLLDWLRPAAPAGAGTLVLAAASGGDARARQPQSKRKGAAAGASSQAPRTPSPPLAKRARGAGTLAMSAAATTSALRETVGVRAPDLRHANKQYGADISFCGQSIYLGVFQTRELAAMAYDYAARKLPLGEPKRLNFGTSEKLLAEPRPAALQRIADLIKDPTAALRPSQRSRRCEHMLWRVHALSACFVKDSSERAKEKAESRKVKACELLLSRPSPNRTEAADQIKVAFKDGRTALAERQRALLELIADKLPPASPADALMEASKIDTNQAGGAGCIRWLIKFAFSATSGGESKAEQMLRGFEPNSCGKVKERIRKALEDDTAFRKKDGEPWWTDGLSSDEGEGGEDREEGEEVGGEEEGEVGEEEAMHASGEESMDGAGEEGDSTAAEESDGESMEPAAGEEGRGASAAVEVKEEEAEMSFWTT